MFLQTSVDFQRTTRRYIPEGRTLEMYQFSKNGGEGGARHTSLIRPLINRPIYMSVDAAEHVWSRVRLTINGVWIGDWIY
jgi:hypothetical protein